MSPKAEQILAAAMELPEHERGDLAEQLRQSLGGFADKDIEAAWVEELERRAAELDSGAVEGIPWEEMRRQIADALVRRNESAA